MSIFPLPGSLKKKKKKKKKNAMAPVVYLSSRMPASGHRLTAGGDLKAPELVSDAHFVFDVIFVGLWI